MNTSVVIAQVPVVWDIDANLATVRSVLGSARPDDVVVLPEGMLSGYGEDLTPLATLDAAGIHAAVEQVADLAVRHRVDVFCGSLLPVGDGWANAAIHLTPSGERQVYRKINLAMNERGVLVAGDELPVFRAGGATVGVQLCREIRFPEQWQHLAANGAQLFAYLTNAANTREPAGVWRSHLISRAAENQRFLAAANIAHPGQHCPTMLVSPRGEVLAELPPGRPGLLRHTIDLSTTGTWYLDQRRQDVIALVAR
ncbi:carbon-nitrogen hydrolase family protein [Paractinoplanes durhamensis]|uniref:CN hydrolase domain-containing protein n=1 Tax=Paractinoplanes durhamensis TaxID=113563 RepID=A0ABQ3Z4U7_9ACTN|nr:carbon-nitrogen hydrolase family protein [Actinoplanes durhamensis]GIE04860.1 hypothetical protein Adu01nite_62100 [Actinoplanes durhamensis]